MLANVKTINLQKATGSLHRRALPLQAARRPIAVRSASPSSPPPVLVWTPDTETFKDVMSFGGSIPERLNGRIAMVSFVAIALNEISTHTPVLDQFSDSILPIIFINFLLTLGSLAPKFLTGTSLSTLHAAAVPESLEGTEGPAAVLLKLIDQNVELWTGRFAMLGVAGLAAVEFGLGRAFF